MLKHYSHILRNVDARRCPASDGQQRADAPIGIKSGGGVAIRVKDYALDGNASAHSPLSRLQPAPFVGSPQEGQHLPRALSLCDSL